MKVFIFAIIAFMLSACKPSDTYKTIYVDNSWLQQNYATELANFGFKENSLKLDAKSKCSLGVNILKCEIKDNSTNLVEPFRVIADPKKLKELKKKKTSFLY